MDFDTRGGKEFLGVGWHFPPKLDNRGALAQAVHEKDIHQAIHIILGTNPGERIMRPEFGAGLRAFVFEPMSRTTMTLLKQRVEQALIRWEPRIEVDQVTVTAEDRAHGKLLINIRYKVRSTNTFYNLVYPFYLAEGERS
jgi:phage baseplate assembly protein W